MGLTVFAIGGCTPEMITGVIMARRGMTRHVGAHVATLHSNGCVSICVLLFRLLFVLYYIEISCSYYFVRQCTRRRRPYIIWRSDLFAERMARIVICGYQLCVG